MLKVIPILANDKAALKHRRVVDLVRNVYKGGTMENKEIENLSNSPI